MPNRRNVIAMAGALLLTAHAARAEGEGLSAYAGTWSGEMVGKRFKRALNLRISADGQASMWQETPGGAEQTDDLALRDDAIILTFSAATLTLGLKGTDRLTGRCEVFGVVSRVALTRQPDSGADGKVVSQ